MAPKGFEVGTDLEAHARQLDALGDALQQAADAANQVSMPTDAYGILCQPFRMMLDPVEEYGINALKDTVTAMDAQAQKVRDAAKAYQSYEGDVAGSMKASD
jgi:excreted virulence factor EspC (type VII ESX diderm)